MDKILLFVIFGVNSVLSANILYVSTVPSPSHFIWNQALSYGLVGKGHNVTFLTPDKDDYPKPENYTHIVLEGIYEAVYASMDSTDSDVNDIATYSATRMMFEMQEFCVMMCQILSQSQNLQSLLNYPAGFKFDVIIYDVTTGTCLYPLIRRFNYPPAIAVTPFLLPSYVSYSFGNQVNPSYVPWHSLEYSSNMNVIEKVWNSFFTYTEIFIRYTQQYKAEHEIAKGIFGDDVPSLEEFERNISLVLTNTDPVLDLPQPLAPNFISVGGLHTRKAKQLPEDLQTILDGAKNGVIIFSLGTNVRSDKLTQETQKALLNAFSKLQEIVIWKFESAIENLPKNVIVRKWFPQNDLLGHPNVRLFIGHGGALSTQEAIFHAVPMICVPFFMDQHFNTRNIVDKKLGVSMDVNSITSDYVLQKLGEVLDNPIYTQNMRQTSNRFKDRTETPLKRGIFWIEYVIRHGGANFLNTPARDLPFYKTSGLDIFAFLIFVILIIFIVLNKLILFISRPFRSKKKVKQN